MAGFLRWIFDKARQERGFREILLTLAFKSATLLPAKLTGGLTWRWRLEGNSLFDNHHPATQVILNNLCRWAIKGDLINVEDA